MYTLLNQNKQAIIILHEIYGINSFILEKCQKYHSEGYDIYCPNLISKQAFDYNEAQAAYHHFVNNVGFDIHEKIMVLIQKLKLMYKRVFVIGFSVGATIAWRCSESTHCDGVICCYGSRIRDYISVEPKCRSLLIFAEKDSINAYELMEKLEKKKQLQLYILNANHGFCDNNTVDYCDEAYSQFDNYRKMFLYS